MEINEIVNNLSKNISHKFPTEAVLEARKHKKELTEIFLENLENIYKNPNIIFIDDELHIFGLFLLAEFKEQRAFPVLINILNKLDEEDLDAMLGDIVTEELDSILASTFNGDLVSLYNIIENTNKDEYLRSAALGALAILYNQKVIKKEIFINYFKKLLPKIENEHNLVVDEFVVLVCDLKLHELVPDVERLFKEKKVDKTFISLEDFKEFLNEPAIEKYEYIKDVVESMSWWACFNDGPFIRETKIGRNEPCPCGSGKKYKKCCGK